jgi:hypothetical protein
MFLAQMPELHLDVSALQRHVLLLEVSTPQGPELQLDLSALQRIVLLLEVSSAQGPELHVDVATTTFPETWYAPSLPALGTLIELPHSNT